jgi:hypothetical protein
MVMVKPIYGAAAGDKGLESAIILSSMAFMVHIQAAWYLHTS